MNRSPNPRILVVDDRLEDRILCERMLRRLGYEVVTAESAFDGLIRLADGWFDLVFMDLFMPETDGAEATRRIRALGGTLGTVPVIGLSGSILPSDRRRCIESGMTDFISKPLMPTEIGPRLSNWIEGRPS